MKKVIQILLMCLIIAGVIVTATIGLNVGLKYGESIQLVIKIGKEVKIEDIKSITNEVFKNQNVLVQPVELYKDMIQITAKTLSKEQIDSLNDKINEKYNIENKVSDIVVTNSSNVKLRDIVRPYIMPITSVSILTIIFAMVVYKRLGIWKVAYIIAMSIVAPQAILVSLYAVTRLPINRLTTIIAIIVYIASITISMAYLNKINEKDEEKI